jgi:hypothetical protein
MNKVEPLVDNLQEIIASSGKELSAFAEFLQSD